MTLTYDVSGTGPTLLLLHSSVCDRRMWDPQWAPLAAAGYRVVRCDFRGFGDSPMGASPYSEAGDVLDLLDHLGADRAAVVGASYGGKVALQVAAHRPERVTDLLLLCPGMPGHVPGPDLRSFGAREDAFLAAGDIEGAVELNVEMWLGPEADGQAREQVRVMQRRAFEVQTAAAEDFSQAGPEVDLADVTARCLAVSGAHDVADFRAIAAELPGRIAGARHLELPWAGHLPGLERPGEVTRLVTEFLRGESQP
ncbi:alpha/beta hydrolase [Streptomyces cocklensis]|uniref:Alpha/beta fold hydrolase n=1 Tax=Actinacidiphila cocklensis TaxID=887465 RepID=A0A9W4E224_9ACTN|nr:alpha/beta hydrolase [Actinacidiphila cocklensis]MDD1061988.1 alpha/beta hydrolase [Actinacidiphila cocklensis]WSX74732.1 alpha/beta hydrolase [Streptomyces sp. NBC_00899]CAG6391217.1 Alpha/beta fold hydrolase [Actinacidiphila cocklensis]